MDITETLAPKSDQLDAVDLQASGPRVFTITGVSKGNSEQPVQVSLAEFPRVWRPSKGMRNVLAAGWGVQAGEWVGRRVRLFCDTTVMFGNDRVGGVRISAMSDLPDGKPITPVVIIKKGRSATVEVDLLPDLPPALTLTEIEACDNPDTLREWWSANPSMRDQIKARVDSLPKKEVTQ